MGFDIKVNKSYTVNNKTYRSIEEMPPDVRELFEKAMKLKNSTGQSVFADHKTKIVFNGTEYPSADKMPEDVRSLFEEVMKTSGNESTNLQIGIPTQNEDGPGEIKLEASFSTRSLIIGLSIMGLLVLVYLIVK